MHGIPVVDGQPARRRSGLGVLVAAALVLLTGALTVANPAGGQSEIATLWFAHGLGTDLSAGPGQNPIDVYIGPASAPTEWRRLGTTTFGEVWGPIQFGGGTYRFLLCTSDGATQPLDVISGCADNGASTALNGSDGTSVTIGPQGPTLVVASYGPGGTPGVEAFPLDNSCVNGVAASYGPGPPVEAAGEGRVEVVHAADAGTARVLVGDVAVGEAAFGEVVVHESEPATVAVEVPQAPRLVADRPVTSGDGSVVILVGTAGSYDLVEFDPTRVDRWSRGGLPTCEGFATTTTSEPPTSTTPPSTTTTSVAAATPAVRATSTPRFTG